MLRAPAWMVAGLLLVLPTSLAAQATPQVDEATVAALWSLVDGLVTGVAAGDTAAIDTAICLDEWLFARLERERALGLVTEELTPAEIGARKDEVRRGAIAFTQRLIQRGREIEWLDFSRLELESSVDTAEEELVAEAGGEMAITGHGVVGVKMLTRPEPSDIEVSRIDDRWCLNPLSMQ